MNTPSSLTNQEKVASALGYIFFIIPFLMGVKTEYSMFHAKQSFAIFILMVIGSIIPVAFIAGIVNLILFLVLLYSALQAYSGNKYVIPFVGEHIDAILGKV